MTLVLDHVAVGLANAQPALRRLTAELGGTVIGGGVPTRTGFRVVQVHLGEPHDLGMTIELLEPFEPWHNDFLERFVAGRGDGPHHLTFKTDDIRAEHERLIGLGIDPIGVRFDTPSWKEMFIHPRHAHGIVVQIAESRSSHPPLPERLELARVADLTFDGTSWWGDASSGRAERSVRLQRVVIGATDVAHTRSFWTGVMGAHSEGDDLAWEGGRLAIVEHGAGGVQRFEVAGLAAPTVIGGTRFVPIS